MKRGNSSQKAKYKAKKAKKMILKVTQQSIKKNSQKKVSNILITFCFYNF